VLRQLFGFVVGAVALIWPQDHLLAQGRRAVPPAAGAAARSIEAEAVVKSYLGWKPLAVGDVGKLSDPFRVIQVVDGDSAIVEIAYFPWVPFAGMEHEVVWMNAPTKGMADDRSYRLFGYFEVAGTKRYTNALGVSKTLMLLKPTADPAAERAKADGERRAARRRAEEDAARAEKAKREREADRTWTYAASGQTLKAVFLTRIADKVKLRSEDGAVLTVPIDDLCEGDKEWIQGRGRVFVLAQKTGGEAGPPAPPAEPRAPGDARSRWVSETYPNTAFVHVRDKEWVQVDAKTGKTALPITETSRSSEFIELFFPTRNETYRLAAKRMELKGKDGWGWAHNGHWEAP
jgi:hypothetical protein